MADLLTDREVQTWQERINASKEWRKQKEDCWKRNIQWLQGFFFQVAEEGQDQIAVNMVFPTVKVIIPAIYSRNPDVLVDSRRDRYRQHAETMKEYIRYLVKELGVKEEVKLGILDAMLFGHGWNKTGYQTDIIMMGDDQAAKETTISRFIKSMGFGSKVDPEKQAAEDFAIEPNERILDESPWTKRTSPFDMFVPAFSKRFDELAWITERIIRPVIDVKANPNYKNTDKLVANTSVRELLEARGQEGSQSHIGSEGNDPDMEFVTLYEIWDSRTNMVYTIAEDFNEALETKENPYGFLDSRHPYSMLRFNEVPDEFYPQDDISPWVAQQQELNSLRTQMNRHRKRFNRRYVVKEGDFSEDDMENLRSGEDGTIAETTGESARDALVPVQDAGLSNDVYAVEARVRDDITNISGITDFQRGSVQQGAKTATEAAIVESQSRFRTDERIDIVSSFALKIIKNIAMMSQKFTDQEQVGEIMGDKQIFWIPLDDDDSIKRELLYDIRFGSTTPENRDVAKQQFMELYQMVSMDPIFDPIKPRLELLRKFDVPDPETWLQQEIAEMYKKAFEVQAQAQAEGLVDPQGRPIQSEGSGGKPGGTQKGPNAAVPNFGGLARGIGSVGPGTRVPGGRGGGSLAR